MCTAAIAFCGVGTTRYLAADPAFVATDDVRAGVVEDPTVGQPELAPWAILANALFLQPAVARGHQQRLERNEAGGAGDGRGGPGRRGAAGGRDAGPSWWTSCGRG